MFDEKLLLTFKKLTDMETHLQLLEKITGISPLWLVVSSSSALLAFFGAGIASVLTMQKKIEQKENCLREIIREKTGRLSSEVEKLKHDNEMLEMLSSVALQTESCVFITDENGEIKWVNPGFTQKTGYSLESFKRVKGNTIMEASCNPNIINIINEALQLKKSVTYESYFYTKYLKNFIYHRSLLLFLTKAGN